MFLLSRSVRRQLLELPISSIRPNPYQPRTAFEPAALQELSESIAHLGVLQPLSVRHTPAGWELVAGERRLRAAQLAGLATVPCLPVEADEQTSSLLALVENLQRRDLDFWEEATALRRLIDQFQLSQEEVARQIGKSQSAVANKLRLLKLPEDVVGQLRDAGLSERHARALLALPSPELQRQAAAHVIEKELTVARTEAYVDRLRTQQPLRRAVPLYRIKDVRLFLNTVKKGLDIMRSSGMNTAMHREDCDDRIILTISISR